MHDPIEFIRENLSQEELLTQLAEECAELSKAALKLRRVYSGENPTPVRRKDAFDNVIEEIADVYLSIMVLGLDAPIHSRKVYKIMEAKLSRWEQRLQEKEKPKQEKQKAIYTGFSAHDACGYYRCPVCGNTFETYSNDYSEKKCLSCNTELYFE